MSLEIDDVRLQQTLKRVNIEAFVLPRKVGVLQTVLQERALGVVRSDDSEGSSSGSK